MALQSWMCSLYLQTVVRELSLYLTTLLNVSEWMTSLAALLMDDFASRRYFAY